MFQVQRKSAAFYRVENKYFDISIAYTQNCMIDFKKWFVLLKITINANQQTYLHICRKKYLRKKSSFQYFDYNYSSCIQVISHSPLLLRRNCHEQQLPVSSGHDVNLMDCLLSNCSPKSCLSKCPFLLKRVDDKFKGTMPIPVNVNL